MSLYDYIGNKLLSVGEAETPQMYGAKANGVADDYNAISALIEANKGKTVYFPEGVYCVSQTIKTYADNANYTNIVLSHSAIIKPLSEMDYLLDVGGIGQTSGNNYKKYVSGGIFDAGNGLVTEAVIRLNANTKQVDLSDCIIVAKDCSGMEIGSSENTVPTDANIHNVNIRSDAGENSNSGILFYGTDNNVRNCRVYYFGTNVNIMAGGQFLSDIHTLASGTGGSNQVAYHIHNADSWFNNCYGDSEETCFKVTGSSLSELFISNFFYYSYRQNATTLFDIEDVARIKANGVKMYCRSGNTHKGVKVPYSSFKKLFNGCNFDIEGLSIKNAQYMQDGDPLKGLQTKNMNTYFYPTDLTTGFWYKVGSFAVNDTNNHSFKIVSDNGISEVPITIKCTSAGVISADISSGKIITTDSGVYQIGCKLNNSGFNSASAFPLVDIYIKRVSGGNRSLHRFDVESSLMAKISPSGDYLSALSSVTVTPDVVCAVDCDNGTVGIVS